ncbi:MAG: hypothetical protein M3044_03970 [Thermoproteota archaeon]|nr:hypothetical protein [Thermoproteota archaeon]
MSQILTAKNLMLHDICSQILEIDISIRFAGFVNNMGTVIAAQHREALMSVEKASEQSLLTKDELELSAVESVLTMVTRKDMMPKLGKPIYSFALYEKVRRATILLENSNNSDCPPILMVSFNNNNEAGTYQESIILNGILPLVSYYLGRVSPSQST